ncbi:MULTISPECIES: OprO/OprP family phosphate-selective porin [unclassified Caulobacter]|uniref:OprO/OprP family phosphate-selective porin n=1 Tax=unclassified Caulobacter TaxID=2648921 RepID=UPI000D3349C1|nr:MULTISPECIES: porin [unclassified Caulobacter]PTS86576.1 porin [Caulobacter sp. HMWF009]PTT12752.1 porin [Caulobacter sp. HMWF025]
MITRTTLRTALIAGVSLLSMADAAQAQTPQDAEARIAALEAQLQALSGQIADLKAATAASLKDVRGSQSATTVSLANARPTLSTGDGAFSVSFRGILQADAAIYDQRDAGPLASDFRRGSFNDAAENDRARDLGDGVNVRRARIGLEGKAFGAFDYNMIYDFGGSGTEEAGKISSAWVQYSGYPVKIRAGIYAPVTSLEDAANNTGSLFAERASVAETVRGLAGGDGRAAIGILANGERWNLSAAVTGNTVTTQTYDEQLGFVGRVAYVPFKGQDWLVHIGANANLVIDPAAAGPDVASAGGAVTNVRLRDRPELRVDGTRLIDTGNIDADGVSVYGLEFGAQRKNLYVQAEYFDIQVERRNSTLSDPSFDGWYVQAGWTLTGEPRRYSTVTAGFDAPRPTKPFNPKKAQWGAVELAARYSTFDLDYLPGAAGAAAPTGGVRGGEQNILSLGVNWYLNPVVSISGTYRNVEVRRLSPGGSAFVAGSTPAAGVQVGQDLDIWSLRTQYAF